MKTITLLLPALLLLALAGPIAAEEEATTAAGARWTLEFTHGPLRIARVEDGSGRASSYHYMVVTVKNPTALPRPWYPLAEAITDTKQTRLAVGNAHALDEIQRAENDASLVALESTAGKIEPGQTLKTVAIFGRLDPNYDKVEIQIHGLVNPITIYKIEKYAEGTVIVDSVYWTRNQEILTRVKAAAQESGGTMPKPEVEYVEVREKRVWSMVYERTGDEFGRDADPILARNEGWKALGEPETLRTVAKPGAAAAGGA